VTPPSNGEPPTPTPEDFFLFVGTTNPRKNLPRTVSAYRAYRQRSQEPHELIVVGPDRDIFADENVPDTPGAKKLGYVSEGTLGWLYRNATALVFPSLYEGFGFPIVEAMSVGTPVVTSNRGVMTEVSGTGAVLVDPEDVTAIADGMERAIEEHVVLGKKGKQQAAEFDWKETGAQTIEVYRKLVDAQ
jgi:glycosyltransferase involved in cell wall biosynthesis